MKAWVRQKAAEVKRKGKTKAAWYVHWREPDGTRRARSCGAGASGKKEAEKLAATIHAQLLSGTYTGDPTLVLWDAFIREYKRTTLKTKSGSHAESIRKSLQLFEDHVNPKTVAQVNSKLITKFVSLRSRDRGKRQGETVSPATVNKDLRNLKLILQVAVDWGHIERLPKFTMLKEPRKLKRYVTGAHFAAMFAAADSVDKPQIQNVTPGDYWRAVLAFSMVTGWRINEVLSIRRDDVDFESGQVIARWDDSKGKRDESIFVPPSVLDLLKPVWRNFRQRPLDWNGSARYMYDVFLSLQQTAGISLPCPEDHEHTDFCFVYGFHDFKRAFATNNAGSMSPTQLQRLMKHSDFTTTQRYINYAKVMTETPEVHVPDVLKKNG